MGKQKMDIKKTPIEDIKEFKKNGYNYQRIAIVDRYCLFSQTDIEVPTIRYFELWKGVKYKQDGELIHRIPKTSEWGQY